MWTSSNLIPTSFNLIASSFKKQEEKKDNI